MMCARTERRSQKRRSGSDPLVSVSLIVVAIQSRSASSAGSSGRRSARRSLRLASVNGSASKSSSSLAGKCSVTVLGATSARSAMSLMVVSR